MSAATPTPFVRERVKYAVAASAGRAAIQAARDQRCSLEEHVVLEVVLAQTVFYSRLTDRVPLSRLSELAHLHPKNCAAALRSLRSKDIIVFESRRGPGNVPIVGVPPVDSVADEAPNDAGEIGAESVTEIGADSLPNLEPSTRTRVKEPEETYGKAIPEKQFKELDDAPELIEDENTQRVTEPHHAGVMNTGIEELDKELAKCEFLFPKQVAAVAIAWGESPDGVRREIRANGFAPKILMSRIHQGAHLHKRADPFPGWAAFFNEPEAPEADEPTPPSPEEIQEAHEADLLHDLTTYLDATPVSPTPALCRYEGHRETDWLDGNRLVCGTCHPRVQRHNSPTTTAAVTA